MERRLGAILAADVVGYSRLMGDNEAGYARRAQDRPKEWLARTLAIDPDDILTQCNAACIYSRVGETDAAFDLLERLLPHVNHENKARIKHDSDFDPMREHPRYQKILELIG